MRRPKAGCRQGSTRRIFSCHKDVPIASLNAQLVCAAAQYFNPEIPNHRNKPPVPLINPMDQDSSTIRKSVGLEDGTTTAETLATPLASEGMDTNAEPLTTGNMSSEEVATTGEKLTLTMTTEETAGAEHNTEATLKKIKDEELFQRLKAAEAEVETEAFQCGRCKQVRETACRLHTVGYHCTEEMQIQAGANEKRRRAYDSFRYLHNLRKHVEVLVGAGRNCRACTLKWISIPLFHLSCLLT